MFVFLLLSRFHFFFSLRFVVSIFSPFYYRFELSRSVFRFAFSCFSCNYCSRVRGLCFLSYSQTHLTSVFFFFSLSILCSSLYIPLLLFLRSWFGVSPPICRVHVLSSLLQISTISVLFLDLHLLVFLVIDLEFVTHVFCLIVNALVGDQTHLTFVFFLDPVLFIIIPLLSL